MLGVHSGFTEIQVDEFSYKFYKGCIEELAVKFNFDSISNVLGNSYAQTGGELVTDANPFNHITHPKNEIHRMTKEQALAFVGKRE